MEGVSIILCTYNGSHRLPITLQHIANLAFVRPWELLVIDNSSIEDIEFVVKQCLSNTNVDFRVIKEPQPGLTHARWCGINNALYEYILFCDDDNHLNPDYLQIGSKILDVNPMVGTVGGCGVPIFESEKPDWFDEFSHSYAVGPQSIEAGLLKYGDTLYGAACFFRRSAILTLSSHGFSSILSDRKGNQLSSGGDTELCIALQLIGYRMWYEPKLIFGHFIEKYRLNWNYYLQLKRGIASSFPLLEVYRYFEFPSGLLFEFHLVRLYFKALLGFVKSNYFFYTNRGKKIEVQRIVTKTKLGTIVPNALKAVKAYNSIKKRHEVYL